MASVALEGDMAKAPAKRGKDQDADQIAIDYIKSPHFRAIRADGAIGGITPNGFIHFSLYSERQAIPRQIVHSINDDGSLGPIKDELTISRGSIVREMDADIFVTLDTAKSLHAWLGEKITTLQKAIEAKAGLDTKALKKTKPRSRKGSKRR